jgi:hypothetical protein
MENIFQIAVSVGMFVFGGVLRHIYSMFKDIHKKNEIQDTEISSLKSNVNVLISQKDDLKDALNELRADVKVILNKVR